MTLDDIKAIMAANPPVITEVNDLTLYFGWGWTGCGFGELYVNYSAATGKYRVDNEGMSKESVRKLLHTLADHIADNLDIP